MVSKPFANSRMRSAIRWPKILCQMGKAILHPIGNDRALVTYQHSHGEKTQNQSREKIARQMQPVVISRPIRRESPKIGGEKDRGHHKNGEGRQIKNPLHCPHR